MIDLHCHSFHSDGLHSPAELIEKAINKQLTCLSLTDHDTLAGYNDLCEAAANTSITVITGIELSVRWKKNDIHILGYQLAPGEEFNKVLDYQINSRIERAKQIAVLLEQAGISSAYDKACELAGHPRAGRPHFAKVLINEGKVKDMQAAFKKYLARGKCAYVPTPWIDLNTALSAIKQAGGQAVIAHPLKYRLTRSKLHELIIEFKEAGGDGIEVVSGDMTVFQVNEMASTAQRFDLLGSSGSDFHGDGISLVKLGCQKQLPSSCTPIWHNWGLKQGTLL